MAFIINWVISAVAIAITALILPGVTVSGVGALLLASLVLGIINALIRPFIIILTLPINIITLGLFTFVINALLVLLTAAIVPGFKVRGFGNALAFAIILTVINYIIYFFIP